MMHMMKKIADWIIEHEESEAEKCSIPDEIIDEWLETIEERKKRKKAHGKTRSVQYEMLLDLEKRLKAIKEIRKRKCHTPQTQ